MATRSKRPARSRLARALGVDSLPPILLRRDTACSLTGLSKTFLVSQIDSGFLPTVVLVPGFSRIHAQALEQRYESLLPECLALNVSPVASPIQRRPGILWIRERFWLQQYANSVTLYAIKAGCLIRGPCAFCGQSDAGCSSFTSASEQRTNSCVALACRRSWSCFSTRRLRIRPPTTAMPSDKTNIDQAPPANRSQRHIKPGAP